MIKTFRGEGLEFAEGCVVEGLDSIWPIFVQVIVSPLSPILSPLPPPIPYMRKLPSPYSLLIPYMRQLSISEMSLFWEAVVLCVSQ